MALQLKDRIWTDVDSSGTNDLIIGAVKQGYSGWDSIALGSTVYYCLVDDVYWEVGHGEYIETGDKRQITRNVLASNTDGKINISSSKSATVFCTYPAEKSVYLDVDGNIQLPEVNVRFKGITGNEVISPVVATGAVIVDGTEAEGGDLAKLLDVYTKDEIQDKINEQDRKNTGKFMPQSGGIFTGAVDFNKTITLNNNFTQVRASVDKPFHTLKTNAPLNADGSQNTNEPFGLSIDLDNNNTFKNQFNIKNRKGEILYVKSGGNPYGKLDFDWTYTGLINKEHHIVNKEYVDNSVADLDSSINLHTLSNNKNTLKWIKADVPLTTLTFGSSNKAINVDNTFYLNRLYNNENSPVDVKDYEPTKDTIFEVWKGNELQVKTTIKFWQQSTFNFNHRRFNPSGNTPTIALTGDFNGSDYYSVILTNMKKVS